MVRIEQDLFVSVAGASGYRVFNKITPVGADVKGGGAIHLALDIRARWCHSGMRSPLGLTFNS